ncbi:unnamed protein product [Chrysodeixis includens]|uniref:Uncharacterized protein n=1 Tax=Chrysodeixis includens TaxID=689277 RepID=A0A9N8KXM2_CHRIL|nr:unnamed protein product [Chrysodeixis includens]
MTPTPQEHVVVEEIAAPSADGEGIVISGMSGLYPSSLHLKDFSDNLYNKVNPVAKESLRWTYSHPEVAHQAGAVPELERFDAQFFKVHYRLGNSMDPMSRKILEQAYHAIYDAGINPEQLSGQKIGVFVGTCFSEAEKSCFYDASSRSGLGITGCCKAMFANRVSYWLNAKGPSMAVDEACCSSTAALEQAFLAISRGECEAAVVGGSNLVLHPQIMKQCSDGKIKSFDSNADGCIKTEAINVLFLQKEKDALRVYGRVIHAKTAFVGMQQIETGPRFGFYRNHESYVKFLERFYEEARIPPHAVEYVEAFGAADLEADKSELDVIDTVFCKEKDDTLLVGSVTSNVGYGEAASGITSITKVLLGYHYGELAANLHCTNPRQDIVALRDGRMRIVTEHERFGRTYAAVNGLSVTGMNSHVLLHGHYKPKDLSRYQTNIPHLVTISGRQETMVKKVLEELKSRPIDPEELALLHNIHSTNISGHLGRGFIILQTNEDKQTVSLCERAEYFDDARRPLWFVYSGMGSQWAGMGTQLMRIPVFAAAIERCRKALEPKGIDIVHIITTTDKTIFDNILHSFVGIAAVQIGLTDVLRELGLVPDGIIGHSVGELGCAYADGCLTAEEMILSAYSRGLVSLQTEFIRGSMAAIGLGYDKISKLCPPEIEVACHNGPESSTISGPADKMKEFVAELTAKGIFAKEVPCSNIAYHSRYIAGAGPGLLKYLTEVIKTPKARSERWVSTSVPETRWNEPLAKTSSAEYHTNNLLNPVLFEETLCHIPRNAVLVEVAPHGLLQAILKRSLTADYCNIALTRRGHPDNAYMVLEAVGKLYMEGYNPQIHKLYPKVEMPVSTGTPFLSHLIEWAHGERWAMPIYLEARKKMATACTYIMSLHDTENEYLQGHVIRGKTLYPYAATLVSVWDTLAMIMEVPKKQLSVEFRDLHFYSQPVLRDQLQLKLGVSMERGTGSFEVLDGAIKVATGIIVAWKPKDEKNDEIKIHTAQNMALKSSDIYELLSEREFSYSGVFRSIDCASASLTEASLIWRDNWVALIDGMFQLNMLRQNHDTLTLPAHVRQIRIDVEEHEKTKIVTDDKVTYKAEIVDVFGTTRCGGILMEHIIPRHLPAVVEDKMELRALKFIPNIQTDQPVSTTLKTFVQLVAENVNKDSINCVGLTTGNGSVFNEVKNMGSDVFGINVRYEEFTLTCSDDLRTRTAIENADLVTVKGLSNDNNVCQLLHRLLQPNKFVISEEELLKVSPVRPTALYTVLSSHSIAQSRLDLNRWRPSSNAVQTTAITVHSGSQMSLITSARSRLSPRHRLVIIAPYPAPLGLKDLVRGWRKESERNMINLILIKNQDGSSFLLDEPPNDDLAFTVCNNGIWGGEYFMPVQDSVQLSNNVTLQVGQVGELNSLKWVEASELDKSGIPVKVHYAGINTTDVKRANGTMPLSNNGENDYGIDFSGVTESGERVMGIVPHGAASSVVRAQPELLWPVPAHWSLEDAATVPYAYAHALYCLTIKSSLKVGMSVLIHGGAGALGQAAIAIALAFQCEVFTTVSDMRKKRFLLKLFPELKGDHIGNSRSQDFKDLFLSVKPTGCDIVISSCSGNLKMMSQACAAQNGTCLDVAQLQNQDEVYEYGLHYLTKERSYLVIDFASLFVPENMENIKELHRLMSEGIRKGFIRPLTRVTYGQPDVVKAFRLLAASRHRGRVLLRMQEKTTQAEPRLTCNSNNTHVILLDEDMFGLKLAARLVARGARKLLIHYNGNVTAKLQFKMMNWQKMGVQVQVLFKDLSKVNNVVELFNLANEMGPVEGVYGITSETETLTETVFANLDSVSRKLCPQLRYFAPINVGEATVGQETCVSRTQSALPGTMITLPQLNPHEGNRDALDVLEHALRSSDSVLVAQLANKQRRDLLQQLATLTGITITNDTPKTTTLAQLGLQEDDIQSIITYFKVNHSVYFTEEEVPQLTIDTILNVEKTESEFQDVKGLGTFLSYVDPDELLATIDMVFLSTLTSGESLGDDEFDTSLTNLCIVPGMEGNHERFRGLCERLKLPALVLQPGLDRPHETVRETAERYTQVLLKKAIFNKKFYLLGFETGILVALEIASILEELGFTGTVYCLGSAPDEVQSIIEENISEYKTEELLQNAVVEHMCNLMVESKTDNLKEALKGAATWPEKVEAGVRAMLGHMPYSAQYARAFIGAALARIQSARRCVAPARALRSQLVMMRAALPNEEEAKQALQKHSQRPVIVHQLSTPLAHVASDIRCASIINQHLDSEILESFEKKNICDGYILNANSFMAVSKNE